jgi:gluconate 2-dehydrogenase gamma chain
MCVWTADVVRLRHCHGGRTIDADCSFRPAPRHTTRRGSCNAESTGPATVLKLVTALGVVEIPARAVADSSTPSKVGGRSTVYGYLTQPESAFLDAAVARLIPAEELGPGAREAGVTHFIDRQLAGVGGAHARNYRQGLWPEGTLQQGFQSPLTPAEIYRAAIAEINRGCEQQFGRVFAELAHEQQDDVLHQLQGGRMDSPSTASPSSFITSPRTARISRSSDY